MKLINVKGYLALLLLSFLVTNFCLAALLQPGVQSTIGNQAMNSANSSYDVSDTNTIFTLIQTVISAFLGLIGVILLAYLLYAGYNWMTARGEEEKVTKAKDTLKRAIVGVIIIVAAYAISIFVMSRLEAGTLKNSGTTSTTPSAAEL